MAPEIRAEKIFKHPLVQIMSPQWNLSGVHIAFGADPICVSVASFLHSILNQWVDFDQTSIDTLLGGGKS